jgi:hypothetical protein
LLVKQTEIAAGARFAIWVMGARMIAINVSEARPHEAYVLEVDGKVRSEHQTFIDALKAGFEIKQKFPQKQIKVHNADEILIADNA